MIATETQCDLCSAPAALGDLRRHCRLFICEDCLVGTRQSRDRALSHLGLTQSTTMQKPRDATILTTVTCLGRDLPAQVNFAQEGVRQQLVRLFRNEVAVEDLELEDAAGNDPDTREIASSMLANHGVQESLLEMIEDDFEITLQDDAIICRRGPGVAADLHAGPLGSLVMAVHLGRWIQQLHKAGAGASKIQQG